MAAESSPLIPELVLIVAEYALVPANTPECANNAVYAQWWPIIELVRVCSRGMFELAAWLTRAYIPPDIDCANLETFWQIARVGGANPYVRRKPLSIDSEKLGDPLPRVSLPAVGTRAALVVESGALFRACLGGHIATVRWLVAEYGLTAVEVRSFYNRTLSCACISGSIELIDWLRRAFDLTDEDARERGGALAAVCRSGNMEALQWVVREFRFSRAEALEEEHLIFIGLLYERHTAPDCQLHMAQWVVDTFGLTRSNSALARGGALEDMARSHSSCPAAVAHWLQGVPE